MTGVAGSRICEATNGPSSSCHPVYARRDGRDYWACRLPTQRGALIGSYKRRKGFASISFIPPLLVGASPLIALALAVRSIARSSLTAKLLSSTKA